MQVIGGRNCQCSSANNQWLAQLHCFRLLSSLESLLYLLHSCCNELTVLVAGMRSRSILKPDNNSHGASQGSHSVPDLSSKAIPES